MLRDFLEGNTRTLERVFEYLYRGNVNMNMCCGIIVYILKGCFRKGYLTYSTVCKVEQVLNNSYAGDEAKVISCESDKISVLLGNENYCDEFNLSDMIIWLTSELINDYLFRERLGQHYEYRTVIEHLKEILKMPDTDINDRVSGVAISESAVYYIEMIEEGAPVLTKLTVDHGAIVDKKTMMKLADPKMLVDKMHQCFYVNHCDGKGRRICMSNGQETKLRYPIVMLLSGKELLLKQGDELIIGDIYRNLAGKIPKDAIVNLSEKEGVSWINPDYDGKLQFWHYRFGKVTESHGLKADTVWQFILHNAYHFDSVQEKKLSYQFWLYKVSQTPVPFSKEAILKSLEIIEEGILQGYVKKAKGYVWTLLPLFEGQRSSEIDVADELLQTYKIRITDIDIVDTEDGVHAFRFLNYMETKYPDLDDTEDFDEDLEDFDWNMQMLDYFMDGMK